MNDDNIFSHRFYAFTISDDGRVSVISIVRAPDHNAAMSAVLDDFSRRADLTNYQRSVHAGNDEIMAEVERQADRNSRILAEWERNGRPLRYADNG